MRENIHPDYVALLADAAESTGGVEDTVAACERALADPTARSATRRAIAADLFHDPGRATARCAAALYEAIQLEAPPRLRVAATESTRTPAHASASATVRRRSA